MTCEKFLPKIGAFVDGELNAAEREEIEAHILSCEACTREAENVQWLERLAGVERVPSVSGAEWTRVLEGVMGRARGTGTPGGSGARLRSLRGGRTGFLVPALALAAALLLGLCTFWWAYGGRQGQPNEVASGPKAPSPAASPVEESATPTDGEAPGSGFADRGVQFLRGSEPQIHEDGKGGATHLIYTDF
jgi:anti-sigma factor RsiW